MCYFYLSYFILQSRSHPLSLCFMIPHFWRIQISYFYRNIAPFGFIWCFLLIRFRLCILSWNTTAVYQWTTSVCSCYCCNTSDINSYHLVMVLSSRFPYCKITLFSFVINKCYLGRYFETLLISYFSQKFLSTSFHIW